MNVEYIEDPFPHIIIHNMYDNYELQLIQVELDYYVSANNFALPEESGSARENDGMGGILKNNLCVPMNYLWRDPHWSNILRLNRKLWDPIIVEQSKKHWAMDALHSVNYDSTLLSYYEKSHYYKPHKDSFNLTALTHFFRTPKMFSGGDLFFPQYPDYTLTSETNRCIIFPSLVQHGVTEVNVEQDKIGYGFGRWTMSQFLRFTENENKGEV